MFEHYRYGEGQGLALAEGDQLDDLFAVVLQLVALALDYQLGDELIVPLTGNTSFKLHDNMPFYVSGILQPTGTPLDRAVLITLEGLEAVHIGWRRGLRCRVCKPRPTSTAAGFDAAPSHRHVGGIKFTHAGVSRRELNSQRQDHSPR